MRLSFIILYILFFFCFFISLDGQETPPNKQTINQELLWNALKNSPESTLKRNVKRALRQGARGDSPTQQNQTPLEYALEWNLAVPVIELLLRSCKKLNGVLLPDKDLVASVLKKSAESTEAIITLLVTHGAAVNVDHVASALEKPYNTRALVRALLAAPSQVLTQDEFCNLFRKAYAIFTAANALSDAAYNSAKRKVLIKKSENILKLLFLYGFEPKTKLQKKLYLNLFPHHSQLLIEAVKDCAVDALRIAISQGASVDAFINADQQETVLHFAAQYGYYTIVEELLGNKADVNKKARSGATPLIVAAGYNHPDVVSLLIRSGADIHGKDNRNFTALQMAAWYSCKRVIRLLIAAGSTLEDMKICVEDAVNQRDHDRLKLLLAAGMPPLSLYELRSWFNFRRTNRKNSKELFRLCAWRMLVYGGDRHPQTKQLHKLLEGIDAEAYALVFDKREVLLAFLLIRTALMQDFSYLEVLLDCAQDYLGKDEQAHENFKALCERYESFAKTIKRRAQRNNMIRLLRLLCSAVYQGKKYLLGCIKNIEVFKKDCPLAACFTDEEYKIVLGMSLEESQKELQDLLACAIGQGCVNEVRLILRSFLSPNAYARGLKVLKSIEKQLILGINREKDPTKLIFYTTQYQQHLKIRELFIDQLALYYGALLRKFGKKTEDDAALMIKDILIHIVKFLI